MLNSRQTHAANKFGELYINQLVVLIYWVRDSACPQQPMVETNWMAAKMRLCITFVESMADIIDAKNQ